MNTDINTDNELRVMQVAYQLLRNVDKPGQLRIISWLQSKLELGENKQVISPAKNTIRHDQRNILPAKLPETDKQKVLAAAGQLLDSGTRQFNSRQIAQELKTRGIVLSNITRTMTELVKSRPSLLIQLKKQGKTMQSRRLFMLSQLGASKAAGYRLDY